MKFLVFCAVLTAVYVPGIVMLAREMRASTTEERRELQSVQLIVAATCFYAALIGKTYQLIRLFRPI